MSADLAESFPEILSGSVMVSHVCCDFAKFGYSVSSEPLLGAGPVQLAGSPEVDALVTTQAGCGGASM